MSRQIHCYVGIVLVAAMVSASAQERKPNTLVDVSGVGTHSCGVYLEYRKTNNDEMTNLYQQWAAGYLVGYRSAMTKPGTVTNLSADLETYTAWLDKWCADDPTSYVSAGLAKLRTKQQDRK
jgi:hypothetical protein